MVGGWFFGDLAKTAYYIIMELPVQFMVGGCFTVVMDGIVLVQYFYYTCVKKSKPPGRIM
jgi:hypothetical protein